MSFSDAKTISDLIGEKVITRWVENSGDVVRIIAAVDTQLGWIKLVDPQDNEAMWIPISRLKTITV